MEGKEYKEKIWGKELFKFCTRSWPDGKEMVNEKSHEEKEVCQGAGDWQHTDRTR